MKLTLKLNRKQSSLLRELRSMGIYGTTFEDMITRILDERLQKLVDVHPSLLPESLLPEGVSRG